MRIPALHRIKIKCEAPYVWHPNLNASIICYIEGIILQDFKSEPKNDIVQSNCFMIQLDDGSPDLIIIDPDYVESHVQDLGLVSLEERFTHTSDFVRKTAIKGIK